MTADAPSSVESRLASLEATLGLASSSDDTLAPDDDINSRIDNILSQIDAKAGERPGSAAAGSKLPTSASSVPGAAAAGLDQDYKEIDRLLATLDAGSVLSHQGTAGLVSGAAAAQQPLTAPLLYRRQEVLASADALAVGMDRLGDIRNLLAPTSAASAAAVSSALATGGTGTRSGASGKKSASSSGGSGSGDSAAERKANAESYINAPILSSERYEYASDSEARRRLHDVSLQVADINARAVSVATRVDSLVSQYHRIMTILSEKCVLADEELGLLERKG